MNTCTLCRSQLKLGVINNKRHLICPNCMTNNNNLMYMKQCSSCLTQFCEKIDKVCECKQKK